MLSNSGLLFGATLYIFFCHSGFLSSAGSR